MTYNVFGGTLNPTVLLLSIQLSAVQQVFDTFFLMLSLHALLSSAVLFKTVVFIEIF